MGVQGVGLGVQGVGMGVQGVGLGVLGVGMGVLGVGLGVQGSGPWRGRPSGRPMAGGGVGQGPVIWPEGTLSNRDPTHVVT